MRFADAVEAYSLDPTPDHLAELHEKIMEAPDYDPLVVIAPAARPLLDAGEFERAAALLQGLMPGAFLSPGAHALLFAAHDALGDAESARRERLFSRLAMTSIRADCDGTQDRPFTVLRVEDEYDVLAALGVRSAGQVQTITENGAFDVHELEDGTEIWFRLAWRTGEEGA